MVSRTKIIEQMAYFKPLGELKHFIDRVGVNLGEAGLVKKGGRGRHAPEMTPTDVTNLLLAVAGSDTASDAVNTVHRLSNLKGPNGLVLGKTIANILADEKLALKINKIVVCRTFPEVKIYLNEDGEINKLFFSSGQASDSYRVDVTIGAALVQMLFISLKKPSEHGWIG